MADQNKSIPLPPGELHLLTIDRDVERDCDLCHGKGYCNACDGKECPCTDCHGTGKRRVRVRGWVPAPSYSEYKGLIAPDNLDIMEPSGIQIATIIRDEWEKFIRDHINRYLDAWLAGTLPHGVAHIEEVDE